MKTAATIIASTVLTSLIWWHYLPQIMGFYDYKWNSVSAYHCVERSTSGHPEMRFDWKTLEIKTIVVCHDYPPNN